MLAKYTANMPLKIISLIIAIVLWFVVLGSRNVELTKEVPLDITTPADLVVANDVPNKVVFRLSGPKAFLRNIFNRKEDPIHVDLSTAQAGLITYRFYSDNIQIPIGVKVVSINPTAIIVKLEHIRRKEVPVKLVTTGQVPPGYHLNKLELLTNTVKIRGAESKVEEVSEVPTVPIDLSQLQSSGNREVALDLGQMPGVKLDGDLPRIQYQVTQSLANFKIRNAAVKVLTKRPFKISPKSIIVYVRCSPSQLKLLDGAHVYGIADLRGKGAGRYHVRLRVRLPSDIKLIKVIPARVRVTLY